MRNETERLVIRPVEASDAAVLAALWSDPEVTRYMGGPRDFEKVREQLMSDVRAGVFHPFDLWPVVEKATGRVVGDCGLIEKEVDGRVEIELVYVFAAAAWGKGYATEAASAVRDHAFHHLGVQRITALIDPANLASARVAEKVGMRFERETRRPEDRLMRVYAMQANGEPKRHSSRGASASL